MPKYDLPLWGQVIQFLRHNLRCVDRALKYGEASEPNFVHPVDVEHDALFADVAIHPMPPNSWPCCLRRVRKSTGKQIVGRAATLGGRRLSSSLACSQTGCACDDDWY